jgi:hypothetical protein
MSSFQPCTKEIPMDALLRRVTLALGFVALLSIAACGGVASSGGTDTSTQSVQGVATPSSVSVVTAKNAN